MIGDSVKVMCKQINWHSKFIKFNCCAIPEIGERK